MPSLRTGVIGCGKVGEIHATALSGLPESDFVAVCDRDEGRATTFAEKYRVVAYTDVVDMVTSGGVQAVTIATPHPIHAPPALEALRAGVHVIVEKPLASSLADCDAMIEAAHNNQRILAMISQRRLYQPVQRIRKAIDDGKIGRPMLGTVAMLGWRDKPYYESDSWRGTWNGEGGGVLVNQAVHQLDILLWFMGEVDEVYGCWDNLNHPYIEVDDTAIAVIRFSNGGLGNILVSNSQNPALSGKVAIFGENGASVGVQTDGGAMFIAGMSSISEPPFNDLWTIPGESEQLNTWKTEDAAFFHSIDATHYYHGLQIRDFLQAILEDREPLVSGMEGRRTVALFTAIYRSQRDNCPVIYPLTPEYDRHDFDGRLSVKD